MYVDRQGCELRVVLVATDGVGQVGGAPSP